MKRFLGLILILCFTAMFAVAKDDLPKWVSKVGAKKQPKSTRIFSANQFGAIGDGNANSTKSIQKAIDECSKKGGIVTFEKKKEFT